jgi:UDP-N-acetylmuramoyl-L-alanyl-D-glutamate--2,6-diaminopimelate ligase
MLLRELIEGLNVTLKGDADIDVRRACDDSRLASPGSLFIARPGVKADGAAFAFDALGRGAAGVVTQDASLAAEVAARGVVSVLVPDAARAGAIIAERLAGKPSHAIRLIGVTGTNGKTTVATLCRQIFEFSGQTCGLIGTVENFDGRDSCQASMTTPGSTELSAMLGRMVANGCRAAAMEVSSHALDQRRADGLRFAAGVFTNLTGDHLDYHGSMEAYARAKARLFELLPGSATAIVNMDDPACEPMVRPCRATVLRCSARLPATCRVEELDADREGGRLKFSGPWGAFDATTRLIGAHNAMNLLQAAAACFACGLSREQLAHAMPLLKAPAGRLQRVTSDGGPVVLVDYAHTDDALERVLLALSARKGAGRLWVVFGCGGDRDRTKRPRMGRVASRLADVAVVTSDNPRTEDPASIIAMVTEGMDGPAERLVEADRAGAIGLAIERAAPDDLVLIAGKGHEREQILPDGRGGVVKRPFDDVEEARRALERRGVPTGTGA